MLEITSPSVFGVVTGLPIGSCPCPLPGSPSRALSFFSVKHLLRFSILFELFSTCYLKSSFPQNFWYSNWSWQTRHIRHVICNFQHVPYSGGKMHSPLSCRSPWLSSQWRFLHHLPSHLTEGLCPRRAGSGICFMKVWGCVLFCTVLIVIKETLIFWAEHSTCHLVRSLGKFGEKANILGFFPQQFSFELKETCFVQVAAFPW